MKYLLLPLVLVSIVLNVRAEPSLEKQSLTVAIGQIDRAKLVDAGTEKVTWKSSQPGVATIYGDGFIVGLRPGSAEITAVIGSTSLPCKVEVIKEELTLVDPSTLQQYDDNRVFRIDGRKCVGSELNGQRAVEADERQNTQTNRVINPKPLVADRPLEWAVEPGTEMYDGAGVLMGTVAPKLKLENGQKVPTSKFNFGMSKVLHGKLCLYSFSTPIIPDKSIAGLIDPKEVEDGAVGTSAWLPIDRVIDKDELVERIGLGKTRLPALPLKEESYKITGGDPKMYVGEFGEMAIVKIVRENNAVPSHYLRRPSGTVNVIYSVPGFGLGGQGLDSFLVTSGAIFRPALGVREFVQPTYYPLKHPKVGEVSPMTMTFIYGAVEVKDATPVYGWIAKEGLSPIR